MDKKFFYRCILMPLIIALLLGTVVFAVLNTNAQKLLPVEGNITIAYHDGNADDAAAPDTIKKNDAIGTVNTLQLYWDADYSLLTTGASLLPQSDDIASPGCLYIRLTAAQAKTLGETALKVTVGDVTRRYSFSREQILANEKRLLALSLRAPYSVVIYYPASDGIGLTSQYVARIYEGAV